MSFTGGYMLEALVKRTHQESPTRRFVHLIVIFEAEHGALSGSPLGVLSAWPLDARQFDRLALAQLGEGSG